MRKTASYTTALNGFCVEVVMDTPDEINTYVKSLRKQHGITQGQMAEALGVSQSTLSRCERCANGKVNLDILTKIVRMYDYDLLTCFNQ